MIAGFFYAAGLANNLDVIGESMKNYARDTCLVIGTKYKSTTSHPFITASSRFPSM
jgi:hypothetical protein